MGDLEQQSAGCNCWGRFRDDRRRTTSLVPPLQIRPGESANRKIEPSHHTNHIVITLPFVVITVLLGLASRGALCNTPPRFSGENFLSGMDNRRALRFRAGFGL